MAADAAYQDIYIAATIVIFALSSVLLKKLTNRGAVAGALLAYLIYLGTDLQGLLALFLFFAFGTAVSSWKKGIKKRLKVHQGDEGRRDIENVLANAGMAGILALLALLLPEHQSFFQIAVAASFATSCSDTFSSELGNVYGRQYFHILSFEPAEAGPDGVISFAGLAFGVAGSAIIAFFSWIASHDSGAFFIILVSGFGGNIIDSLLGGSLQRRGLIDNHQVNFLATASGAVFAMAALMFFT